MEFGSGSEEMSKVLFAGDNIAVLCESVDTNEDFWLIMVDMLAHTVVSSFTDGWNQTFFEGNQLSGVSTTRESGKDLGCTICLKILHKFINTLI
jgi:hypothetical protein